jgi:CHAT domain-containing protein
VDPFEDGVDKMELIKILVRKKYDVVHYTGHANFDSEQPEKSALKLLSNGDLTFDEIRRLRFPQESRPIVFINACSSSKTTLFGDKTVSLSKAFIEAGALAYIGTMWPIKDTIAAKFASKFYTDLKKLTIGESLRSARHDIMIHTGSTNKSVTWLPYALYGDTIRRIRGNKPVDYKPPAKE